jgi:hypothetical protein
MERRLLSGCTIMTKLLLPLIGFALLGAACTVSSAHDGDDVEQTAEPLTRLHVEPGAAPTQPTLGVSPHSRVGGGGAHAPRACAGCHGSEDATALSIGKTMPVDDWKN